MSEADDHLFGIDVVHVDCPNGTQSKTSFGYQLELDGGEVADVHGSPSVAPDSVRLVHVSTLFPSPKDDGEARGGVILVRIDDDSAVEELELVASWTERDGSEHEQRCAVELPAESESFDHTGIRKAVVLARYARELRAWADDVHRRASGDGVDDWLLPDQRGEHEREFLPLTIPDRFVGRFERLGAYLTAEADVLDDSNLEQELTLLDRLVTDAVDASEEVSGR